ncbi:MAG: hypothetical protein ISS72_09900 [Candidatus Brocadiae bacterium]|nr:hypothetical protein [Candidatus Brocadiia bacterium]
MSTLVLIPSDPAEAGRLHGSLAADALRARLALMHQVAGRAPVSRGELEERAQRFAACLKRIAPAWLDEAEAMASAAGVDATDLLALNALRSSFWNQAGGCTSALVTGSASSESVTLLHKNRDLIATVQDAFVRLRHDGGRHFASRDIGSLGYAHFHGDCALAGGNNTGSPIPDDELHDCALNCTHLLRLVAERASSCDEALAVLEDAVAKGVAGGSGGFRGMIFLFAEPAKGVVVEMTSRRLAHREVADGTLMRSNHFRLDQMLPYRAQEPVANTLRRCERAEELLAPLDAVSPADLVRLSRDRQHDPDALCTSDAHHAWMTVSACTHVVREGALDPTACTHASIGNPRNTLCLPLPRAIDGLPAECASGEFYQLAEAVRAGHGMGDHLAAAQAHENDLRAGLAKLAAALTGQPAERVRAELTAFTADTIERVSRVLRRFGS